MRPFPKAMTITTKFDVGQRVWIMHDNEPQEWVVEAIHIGDVIGNTHRPTPLYDLHTTDPQPLRGVFQEKNVWEHKIKATKRELCLSFLTDND